jgi:hypothetical protein
MPVAKNEHPFNTSFKIVNQMNYVKTIRLLAFGGILFLGLSACESAKEDYAPEALNGEVDFRAHNTAILYASSNTSGQMGIFEVGAAPNVNQANVNVSYADADGIAYVGYLNTVFQLDRTNNRVKAYNNANTLQNGSSPVPSATSTSDFTNGREIAFGTGKVVVAQDADPSNGNLNKLVVYRASGFSLNLYRSYTVPINTWGIQAQGNDLWAVVDNSNMLSKFDNFFDRPSGNLSPTSTVQIQGIVRTHGLHYDAATDIMVMTDVGDAASATDGAVHVITGFAAKYAAAAAGSGMITLAQQIRIAGGNTLLGNPVDVAYSDRTNKIHVAERANGGGRILIFNMPTVNGNPTPIYNQAFAGATAVDIAD